jgi:hypothetical protein
MMFWHEFFTFDVGCPLFFLTSLKAEMQKMVSRVPHHQILENNNKNDQISILGSDPFFYSLLILNWWKFGVRTFYNFKKSKFFFKSKICHKKLNISNK